MRRELEQGSVAGALSLVIERNGRRVVPGSCVVDIYRDGVQLIDAGVATVSGDGECEYTVSANVTEELAAGVVAIWRPVVDGREERHRRLFDVVRNPLYPTIDRDDVVAELPGVLDRGFRQYGSLEDGTATTFVDTALIGHPYEWWINATVEITSGDNAGEVRSVAAFDARAGAVTVDSAFPAALASGDEYVLTRGMGAAIGRAWDELMGRVRQQGFRPALIMDADTLADAHLFLTLEKISRALSSDSGDVWWHRADHYRDRFEAAFNGLEFRFDVDEDEAADAVGSVQLRFRR